MMPVRKTQSGDPLTATQREVLDYIVNFQSDLGMPPTYRDLMAHFRWAGPNSAAGHLKALESKGYITRYRNASRGIAIIETGYADTIWGRFPIGH